MKAWPRSSPPTRHALATGASCSAPSIASNRSRKPTSAASPMKSSPTPIARWESSRTPLRETHPVKVAKAQVNRRLREVVNEADTPHPVVIHDPMGRWVGSDRAGLEAGSHSATARLQAAAAQTHPASERLGDFSGEA